LVCREDTRKKAIAGKLKQLTTDFRASRIWSLNSVKLERLGFPVVYQRGHIGGWKVVCND
jgi:hypothetical protein